MGNIRLTIFARTDVGRVRTNNEDAFLIGDLDTGARVESGVELDVNHRGILMVISDGMGGHAAGDVASALVVESLRKSLSDPAADHSSLQRLIDHAVQRANDDVHQAARSAERRGMGATLTAVLVHETDAYVAEVGDSRGYLLRAGRLRQITKDQSFVQMLVDLGAMSPEQARDAPGKNVILQAMGREADVQVSIGRLRLRRGDRLLLCSDGLSNKLADRELEGLLAAADFEKIADRMVDLANERGAEDNVTAVVAVVEGDGLPVPADGEQVTQTLEILQEFSGPGNKTPRPAAAAPVEPPAPVAAAAPVARPAPAARAPLAPKAPPPLPPNRTFAFVLVILAAALGAAAAWRFLT